MSVLLELDSVNKFYDKHHALKDLSLKVNKGEVLGFLGPNGAGKTTTMKIITGYIEKSSGKVEVCGLDIEKEAIDIKKDIGYVPEGSPLYEDMSVYDFLLFCAEVRQMSVDSKKIVKEIAEKVSLTEVLHKQIEKLSKGFKRRVGIAQALLHDPQILILDEPTDGLDPNQKQQIRKLLKEIKKEKAIIISTHILDEVDALCDRVIIINKGELVVDSSYEELTQNESLEKVFINLTGGSYEN